jgi:hypothetical protein
MIPSSSSSSSAVEVKTADQDDHHQQQQQQQQYDASPTIAPQFDVGILGEFPNTKSLVASQDTAEWRNLLTTGSRVDAQDGDSMWYESVIEDSTSDNITVRFLGWSRKWNALLPRDSRRIAPRNSQVPAWRQTLTPGKCVEVSTSDSCTWCTAVVSVVEPTRFQVIRAPACTTEWHAINSPLIAEPYTHCGYKIEADARERRRMLAARRNLFNAELQICYSVRAMSSRIRVAQHLGEHLLGISLPDSVSSSNNNNYNGESGKSSEENLLHHAVNGTIEVSPLNERGVTTHDATGMLLSSSSSSLYSECGEAPFSDVIFVVEGERIHAHRAIVISRSPYFHRMFLGGMREATEETGNEISIADTRASTFRCVIKYMYTGMCNVHHNNALELLHAAHLFCLDGLAKAIEVFLYRAVSTETAMEIIVAANTFSLIELEAHCVEYIIDHYEMFVPHLSKLAAHPQILIMIMESMRKPKKRRSKPQTHGGSSKEGAEQTRTVTPSRVGNGSGGGSERSESGVMSSGSSGNGGNGGNGGSRSSRSRSGSNSSNSSSSGATTRQEYNFGSSPSPPILNGGEGGNESGGASKLSDLPVPPNEHN